MHEDEQLKIRNAALEKELEIQTALESVREIALSMKEPADMPEVCRIIAHQLQSLGVQEIRNVQTAIFYEGRGTYMNYEYYLKHDKTIITETSYTNHEIPKAFADQMLKGNGRFYSTHINGSEVKDWLVYQKTTNVFIDDFLETASSLNYYWFSLGPVALGISTYDSLTDENINLFKRFLKVFELAYRRFLDIEIALDQAKEARIETALERVRSRSMGMQKSEELKEVIKIVYDQFVHLNINIDHAGFVVDYTPGGDWHFWIADKNNIPSKITHPYFESIWANQFDEAKRKGGDFFATSLNFEEKNKFYNQLLSYIPGLPEESINFYLNCPALGASTVLNGDVSLYIENFSGAPYSDEENKILMRFGKVFQQTYTRFLDLQKAEEQAAESKVQLALERVRAKTMAMQKSDELSDAVYILFQQFKELNQNPDQATIGIVNEKEHVIEYWVTMYGSPIQKVFKFSIDEPHVTNRIYNAWKENRKSLVIDLSGKELFEFSNYRESKGGAKYNPNEKHRIINVAFFSKGLLNVQSTQERSEESIRLLERFAAVFEQTYTRFLDLQKAEVQARESQIELSLERLRAKTMAMHNSADVGETAAVMVDELKKLGIETIRCGIGIMHEPGDMEVWTISTDENNKTDIIIGWLDMNMHPLLHGAFESWRKKIETYDYELQGEDLLDYYKAINNYPGYPIRYDTSILPNRIHHNEFHFAEGTLFAFSLQQLMDEQRKIFKRFANVFGQTYRRYLDLKKAEAQAREAQIETALERVRSRTLAMQKSEELAETSAVLFKQLIALGISPNRLYISIMKNDGGDTEFWITDEDGSKVSMAYEDNLNNNISFKKMFDGWKQQKKSLVIDMKDEELQDYFKHLSSIHVPFKDSLTQKRRLQYLAYFSKGFIGMAAPAEQPPETLRLLERFAYVFNLTFTRFNDLQIAEAHAVQAEQDLIEIKMARRNAEDALIELQATQKQLIQSEKMASLGELTAGIAHEIQNPLNFVNNFSEVNRELISELVEEVDRGHTEEVKAIANDIKGNSEKINHHGKRADAIVKGMLQHSRSSTNQKEMTDINMLADEYLRLAYHGLRAKDKSFNAILKTDFDAAIQKINIIPQDIGRVLLNLLTNAFYAVNEKKKQSTTNYEPLVEVATTKSDNQVFISVCDNGNGVPKNIIDKIFHPFFTTKPTGQGTGLGLSLAYDIVKAHGGELTVETKDGEGSEFIVGLPVV